jgi:formylglycine-generating enzyme required for sulfatase activity
MNRKLMFCILTCLVLFSSSNLRVFAQDFLNTTQIVVQAENITQDKVVKILEKNDRFFSDIEVRALMDSVVQYNADLDIKIHKTTDHRQELVESRQRLLQQKNYIKLTEQLTEAEANYSEILTDIKKSISDIPYKGFFICIIKNISPMDDPEQLIERAKAYITPIAVEDIMGYHIQSVTELYRKEGFEDQFYSYIREQISGKLEVETKFHHIINPADRVFWYACKVSVSPLDEKLKTSKIEVADGNANVLVLNALKESDHRGRITSFGIKRSIASEIESLVKSNRMAIENENRTINARKENIISNGHKKLEEQVISIKQLQLQIEQAHISLQKIIEGNTPINYQKDKMAASIEAADRFLLGKIKELLDQELKFREMKLQAEWERVIATPGNPRLAISNNVVELKNQFETNYGKVEQFIEVAELFNDDLSLSQGRKVTHQRSVDRMWVYLEPLSTGFKLHFVAQFRIEKGSTATFANNSVDNNVDVSQPNNDNNNGKGNSSSTSQKPLISLLEPLVVEVVGSIIEMVGVSGATFTMGCTAEQGSDCWSNENPSRDVTINDFYIGKYEVTQALWMDVMESTGKPGNPSHFKGCDYCPVENVSWNEVKEFIKRLNDITGLAFRLPTEAEWEFAARGGNKSQQYKYSGSNTAIDVAWHYPNSKRRTQSIGSAKPNELGIHDMSGNVSEWCEDDWHLYLGANTDGKPWIDSPRDSRRVNRGGNWTNQAISCRVSSRNSESPWNRNNGIGFRLAFSKQ